VSETLRGSPDDEEEDGDDEPVSLGHNGSLPLPGFWLPSSELFPQELIELFTVASGPVT